MFFLIFVVSGLRWVVHARYFPYLFACTQQRAWLCLSVSPCVVFLPMEILRSLGLGACRDFFYCRVYTYILGVWGVGGWVGKMRACAGFSLFVFLHVTYSEPGTGLGWVNARFFPCVFACSQPTNQPTNHNNNTNNRRLGRHPHRPN